MENINALNALTDGIPQSQLAFSQQLMEKSFGKVDLVLKIARMKDPVDEYNKHIAAGNRFNERDYCFVEVKSPTDQLAEQQRCWLERFRGLGIPVRVLRVRWKEG